MVVWKRSAAMLAEEGLGLPGASAPAEVSFFFHVGGLGFFLFLP